jgi:hypothetical protein
MNEIKNPVIEATWYKLYLDGYSIDDTLEIHPELIDSTDTGDLISWINSEKWTAAKEFHLTNRAVKLEEKYNRLEEEHKSLKEVNQKLKILKSYLLLRLVIILNQIK